MNGTYQPFSNDIGDPNFGANAQACASVGSCSACSGGTITGTFTYTSPIDANVDLNP